MAQLAEEKQTLDVELKETTTTTSEESEKDIEPEHKPTDSRKKSKSIYTFSEKVNLSSSLLTSNWNSTITSVAKTAMDWLVWNTETDRIFWSFNLKESSNSPTTVALSIDDAPGWHLSGIIELLDMAKQYQIHCTFFVISSMIRDPE